jgi:hypothetical protein
MQAAEGLLPVFPQRAFPPFGQENLLEAVVTVKV